MDTNIDMVLRRIAQQPIAVRLSVRSLSLGKSKEFDEIVVDRDVVIKTSIKKLCLAVRHVKNHGDAVKKNFVTVFTFYQKNKGIDYVLEEEENMHACSSLAIWMLRAMTGRPVVSPYSQRDVVLWKNCSSKIKKYKGRNTWEALAGAMLTALGKNDRVTYDSFHVLGSASEELVLAFPTIIKIENGVTKSINSKSSTSGARKFVLGLEGGPTWLDITASNKVSRLCPPYAAFCFFLLVAGWKKGVMKMTNKDLSRVHNDWVCKYTSVLKLTPEILGILDHARDVYL